jgi:hypothetical protein
MANSFEGLFPKKTNPFEGLFPKDEESVVFPTPTPVNIEQAQQEVSQFLAKPKEVEQFSQQKLRDLLDKSSELALELGLLGGGGGFVSRAGKAATGFGTLPFIREAGDLASNLGTQTGKLLAGQGFDPSALTEGVKLPSGGEVGASSVVGLLAETGGTLTGKGISAIAKGIGKLINKPAAEVVKDLAKEAAATGKPVKEVAEEVVSGPEAFNRVFRTGPESVNKLFGEAGQKGFKQVGEATPPELVEPIIRQDLVDTITKRAVPLLQAQGKSKEQISTQVADLVRTHEGMMDEIKPLLNQFGLTLEDLANSLKNPWGTGTVSKAGRILAYHSRLQRELTQLFKGTEVEKVFDDIAAQAPQSIPGRAYWYIANLFNKVDDVTRASIVSQLSTATRNAETQGLRIAIEPFDSFLAQATKPIAKAIETGSLRNLGVRKSVMDGFAEFMAQFKTLASVAIPKLGKANRNKFLSILEEFPIDKTRLYTTPIHEVAALNKYSQAITTFNRVQEGWGREVAFAVKLAGELEKKGININTVDWRKMAPETAEKMIADAADFGLEATFAMPATGEAGRFIMEVFEKVPFLKLIQPFARFNYINAYKFLWDFSPAGFVNLLSKNTRQQIIAGNSRAISRAMIGSSFLAMGLGLRASRFAGPKAYELQTGPNPDDEIYDTRPFSPFFAPYLIMAEAMINPKNISKGDVATLLIGLNRIAGTGLVFADLFTEKSDWQGFWKGMEAFMGQYTGRFTVPLRTIKDFIAAQDPQEAILRTTKNDPLIDPLVGNIPYVSQSLDPLYTPFEPGPIRIEHPAFKQLTGVLRRPANPLRAATLEHNLAWNQIFPVTGDPKANNLIVRNMGILTAAEPLDVESHKWQALSPPRQKALLIRYLAKNKSEALKMFKEQEPGMALKMILRREKTELMERGVSEEEQQELIDTLFP